MSDDDLIRRGDALNAIKPIYGWSITAAEEVWGAIAAMPAVTAPQGVDALQAAGRHMLALHDDFLRGGDVDIAAAKRLHLAASFGAQAFAVCPIPDARPAAMMRSIALALIDPMHPDLDYLRRVNMARPVEAPMMTDLMVDPESIDAFLEANPLTPKPVDDSLAADPAVKEWNAAIREAAELLGEAAKNQTPARAETVKACGRAILALIQKEPPNDRNQTR